MSQFNRLRTSNMLRTIPRHQDILPVSRRAPSLWRKPNRKQTKQIIAHWAPLVALLDPKPWIHPGEMPTHEVVIAALEAKRIKDLADQGEYDD
jgi:hypothetical protein